MRDDLNAAVEELYQTFAEVPLAEQVDFCAHCVDPERVETLRRVPLRRLAPEHLGPLMCKATTTWGDLTYFTHFLPRLLELLAAGDMEEWSYPSFLPSRLARCLTEGTESQRSAIDDFLRAWWFSTLSSWPSPCQARDVLDTIDRSGLRVVPYLAVWPVAAGEPATRHLAAFVSEWVAAKPRHDDQVWLDVDRWFRGPVPSDLLEAAFVQANDPSVTTELADAVDFLDFYRSLRGPAQAEPLP
jgi:hypothetical protein